MYIPPVNPPRLGDPLDANHYSYVKRSSADHQADCGIRCSPITPPWARVLAWSSALHRYVITRAGTHWFGCKHETKAVHQRRRRPKNWQVHSFQRVTVGRSAQGPGQPTTRRTPHPRGELLSTRRARRSVVGGPHRRHTRGVQPSLDDKYGLLGTATALAARATALPTMSRLNL